MSSYLQDYHARRGAYRHLSTVDVQVVADVLGVAVSDLCETAERCDEQIGTAS